MRGLECHDDGGFLESHPHVVSLAASDSPEDMTLDVLTAVIHGCPSMPLGLRDNMFIPANHEALKYEPASAWTEGAQLGAVRSSTAGSSVEIDILGSSYHLKYFPSVGDCSKCTEAYVDGDSVSRDEFERQYTVEGTVTEVVEGGSCALHGLQFKAPPKRPVYPTSYFRVRRMPNLQVLLR
ncbi:hypothetical protein BDV98DRAFT_74049 [Pterulicium gracile]|uniref:Uncharacterized protein n=1 Tax=Pterulicium gracile TaxID=1884261 RepID=A0A5C3QIS5_9AGAR|nr:hypothetical protein BDV98DRAFT_74049 [Pterula gracilis]